MVRLYEGVPAESEEINTAVRERKTAVAADLAGHTAQNSPMHTATLTLRPFNA
jgi:hypothetical protein